MAFEVGLKIFYKIKMKQPVYFLKGREVHQLAERSSRFSDGMRRRRPDLHLFLVVTALQQNFNTHSVCFFFKKKNLNKGQICMLLDFFSRYYINFYTLFMIINIFYLLFCKKLFYNYRKILKLSISSSNYPF